MARSLVLAIGVLMWAVVAVSILYLYSIGHWIAPTVTIVVGAPMIAIRAYVWQRRMSPATA
jgi:uncharacterized membrane protein YjjP (DUF1212 family)